MFSHSATPERATTAMTGLISLRLMTSCGTPGWMKMKTPAELSIDFSRFSPYSWCTSPYRMKSMTSKPTWICTNATAPGGTVATFIESSWAPTFLAAILVL